MHRMHAPRMLNGVDLALAAELARKKLIQTRVSSYLAVEVAVVATDASKRTEALQAHSWYDWIQGSAPGPKIGRTWDTLQRIGWGGQEGSTRSATNTSGESIIMRASGQYNYACHRSKLVPDTTPYCLRPQVYPRDHLLRAALLNAAHPGMTMLGGEGHCRLSVHPILPPSDGLCCSLIGAPCDVKTFPRR